VSSSSNLNSDRERGEGKRKESGGRRPCHGWPAGIVGGGAGKRRAKEGGGSTGINFPLIAT
jgi:hypothetical protein